jgi:membrane protein
MIAIDLGTRHGHPVPVFRLVKVLWGAAVDFFRTGCSSLAASIAFFFLLSLFPLVFLLVQLLGYFVGHDQARYEFVRQLMHGFFPRVGIAEGNLVAEIQKISSTTAIRWAVLLAFVWSAMQVFGELDYAINAASGSSKKRNPLVSTFVSMSLLVLVQLLLIGAYIVTEVLSVTVSQAPRIAGLDLFAAAAGRFLLRRALPPALMLCGLTLLYRYLPRERPSWRRALAGALVFAPLWEAAKYLFAAYVLNSAYYGLLVGSILAGVLTLLWSYCTAALILYGAAVVRRLGGNREEQ